MNIIITTCIEVAQWLVTQRMSEVTAEVTKQ